MLVVQFCIRLQCVWVLLCFADQNSLTGNLFIWWRAGSFHIQWRSVVSLLVHHMHCICCLPWVSMRKVSLCMVWCCGWVSPQIYQDPSPGDVWLVCLAFSCQCCISLNCHYDLFVVLLQLAWKHTRVYLCLIQKLGSGVIKNKAAVHQLLLVMSFCCVRNYYLQGHNCASAVVAPIWQRYYTRKRY
jgi:hypothetical protein